MSVSERSHGSTRSRLFRGLAANSLAYFLNASSKILLVPLFLHAWGTQTYGEWLIVSTLVAYLSLMDFGAQVYVVNRLTQTFALKDTLTFGKILNTATLLFVVIPILPITAVLGLLSLPMISMHMGIVSTSRDVIAVVVLAMVAQVWISLPLGILLGVYRAVGMLARGVMLSNVSALFQIIFIALALALRADMRVIAVIQCISYFALMGWVVRDLRIILPRVAFPDREQVSLSTAKELIGPSLHFFSIQLSQMLPVQGTLTILGALQGAAPVVVLSTLRTLPYAGKQLLGLLAHTAWPELTRFDAAADSNSLNKLFGAILRTTMLASVVLCLFLHFFGAHVVVLWVGKRVPYDQLVMDLLVAHLFPSVFWTAAANLLMATNAHLTLARIILVSSLGAMALAYFGAYYHGIHGLIGGLIAADLLLPFWAIPKLVGKRFHGLGGRFFISEFGFPVLVLISGGVYASSLWVTMPVLIGWWVQSLRGGKVPSRIT